MHLTFALALATYVQAHGTITQINGANGVIMPGLNIFDGIPRFLTAPETGAQDDTAIIRESELGTDKASALGWTTKGPVNHTRSIEVFLGVASTQIPSSEVDRNMFDAVVLAANELVNPIVDALGKTKAGLAIDGAQEISSELLALPSGDDAGELTTDGFVENRMHESAGVGATAGLPTASDDGIISVVYHQVDQDGAGPLLAEIDSVSGGYDPEAFKPAEVIVNVPGRFGVSLASTRDYQVRVRIPEGMVCTGSVAGLHNVCIARIRNTAITGPFGGSVAFTQKTVQSRLARMHIARGIRGVFGRE